jgi:2-enoate reductase
MLGRPLLADPHWPNKAYAGKVKEIIPCIGDHEGCFKEFIDGGHPQCGVNPRTGFEDIFPDIAKSLKNKKVAVIGAGPAGVICACTAAERGHDVIIFDSGKTAGGLLIPGSKPKIKFDVYNYVNYLNNRLSSVSKEFSLKVVNLAKLSLQHLLRADNLCNVICNRSKAYYPRISGE